MQKKHIHLIGICGTAMASLAGLLQLKGHRVTGSDQAAYPPMSDLLRSLHISVAEPFSADNLKPHPDLVIVGNAMSRGNVELEYVLDQRIPFTSLAELIHAEFLSGRESLVVAGTHGKTTTTSMLAWIYEVASRTQPEFAPSFLIGGVAENFKTSFHLCESRPFILEGDEYDTAFFDKGPKFMHYFPDALILTHVEFDHADIYRDLDQVKTAFKRLVNLVPQRGRIVAYDGAPNVSECVSKAFCTVERYGFAAESEWRVADMQFREGHTSWKIFRKGEFWADLTLPMAGEHNALNATAAAALAAGQGVAVAAIQEALATFESVKRRLEVRAVVDGVTIIDDFAHHPTAIRETLRALRGAHPEARLWAVLEPRSNTLRRNIFERELIESLSLADRVVLAGVFKQESIPEDERLHPETVVSELKRVGKNAMLLPNAVTEPVDTDTSANNAQDEPVPPKVKQAILASAPASKPSPASVAPPAPATVKQASLPVSSTSNPTSIAAGASPTAGSSGAIMVQIAAVSHQEDANALVSALRQHGYTVSVRSEPQDKLLHVQVGPFATRDEAKTMRSKLLADGYNAILKP